MRKSHKFFLIIGILLLFQLFLLGLKYPAPLYSPGDLTEKHLKIRCRDCHAAFRRVPSESCSNIRCHPDGKVGKRPAIKDLHVRMEGKDCLLCHTDHLGVQGKITKPFEHKLLSGRDQCMTCHKSPGDELHLKARGDCRACHGTDAWKPSTYDHDNYFSLDRTHNVNCSKCHDRTIYKQYNCMNCHEHATRGIISEHLEEGIRNFGDCLRCHSVFINGRRYGTDKTGEGMMDDEEQRYESIYDRYRHDDDDEREGHYRYRHRYDDD
jgi:hypothetical protein